MKKAENGVNMTQSINFTSSGFPRSGNNFLIYSISSILGIEPKQSNHTVYAIENSDLIYVPFRNPLDCISSWNLFHNKTIIEKDIKYYLRFYNAALNSSNTVVLMDFDKFITDLNYIATKINSTVPEGLTIDQIKQSMIDNGRDWNLPRDNQAEIDEIRNDLSQMPEFQECLDLYEVLKTREQI